MRGIRKLLLSHIQGLEEKRDEINPEIRDATIFILREIAEAYDVLALLLKNDKFRSCLPTARFILENAVTLLYIYKEDSERRANNYLTFFSVNYLKRLDKFSPEEVAGHEHMLDGIRAIHGTRNPTGNNKSHWDGLNFREMCVELDMESIYEEWYTRLSSFSHGQYKGGGDLESSRPYFNFLRKLVLRDLVVGSLEALLAINTKYNLRWGFIHMTDYPHEDSHFFFSINHRYDNPPEAVK